MGLKLGLQKSLGFVSLGLELLGPKMSLKMDCKLGMYNVNNNNNNNNTNHKNK